MSNQEEFKNKVVIVTGSGQGIGRNIASAFAKKSATVIINSTDLLEADLVLNSHKLPGHQTSVALSSPMVFDSPGEYEVSNIFVYGRNVKGNIVYYLVFEDIKIAFLGEFGHEDLSNTDLELIEGADILILRYTVEVSPP